MKRILSIICLLALGVLAPSGASVAPAQSGINRQAAGQRNPARPNRQNVPPAMRGRRPLGPLPGVALPGNPNNPNRGANPRLTQQQFRRQQLLQALALTPDQQLRMREIRRRHEDDAIVVGRRLRQARQALDRALFSEAYSEAQIRQLTEELVTAQSDQIRLQSRLNTEIRQVMTGEQLRRFRQKERELKRQQQQQKLLNQDDRPPDPDKRDGDEDDEETFFLRLFGK